MPATLEDGIALIEMPATLDEDLEENEEDGVEDTEGTTELDKAVGARLAVPTET